MTRLRFSFLILAGMLVWTGAAAELRVLVTLKPLHALVSDLCTGATQPQLLLQGTQSPHDYQLKPSEQRALESANMVIYASDQVESFISKLPASGSRRLLAMDQLPDMPLLAARTAHHDEHDKHADHDGHVWLSPVNAAIMTRQLADIFSRADPANAAIYIRNRDSLLQRLEDLQNQIRHKLDGVQQRPFLQFHDALQYFEHDFALRGSLVVTTGTEHTPGARHVRELQQQIKKQDIRCFVYEPPQPPRLLHTLDVNRNARMQAIDIHGSQLDSGPAMYFKLMLNIASDLESCLKQGQEP